MKVYIIPDLDLSVNTVIQVQNILLKVIEEPPEHTAIILTARSKEIFLPTIISRVLSLGMTSVTEAKLFQQGVEISADVSSILNTPSFLTA